jgi:hypothetical protein
VWAGALQQGVNLLTDPDDSRFGLPYAVALLGILGVHEFGHYFTARRYGVDVTLPYFIPVPMGLGTFGAFIQIKSLIRTRRAVFDIGIAGPLAGLVVALPVLYFGLRGAPPLPDPLHVTGVYSGSSLLLALMYQFANGGALGTAVIRLSPVGVRRMDRPVHHRAQSHACGSIGRRSHGVRPLRAAASAPDRRGNFFRDARLGLTVWPGLLTWALLIVLIAGFSHMPALDDVTPVDGKRFVLGALASRSSC